MNAPESKALSVVAMPDDELLPVLQSSLYPGASMASLRMVLGYCRAARLDPMQKPVHIVPMWDAKAGQMRDVVMPGVGLYRTQAARSGCAGIGEPDFGPDETSNIGGVTITYPKWCRVTVRRRQPSGAVDEFTAREFWVENYAVKGGKEKSIAPNAMWAKRPYGQIAKCAEAQALRKAFPEICAQPTAEEMEGRSLSDDVAVRPEPAPRPELPAYAQADFDTNLPKWQKLIDDGKGTAQALLAKLSTKATFSEEQKARILSLKPQATDATPAPPAAEPPPPAATTATDDWTAAYDAAEEGAK